MVSLGAEELRQMLRAAARRLEAAAAGIDALNVFPIPDGDTGTNMLLTMRAALRAVQAGAAGSGELSVVADAAARGALLGARGNSGVILSQILLGLAQGLQGAREAGPSDLRRAFRRGSALAFTAVSRPVEGTMLTVIREASEAPLPAAAPQDLAGFLEATLAAARQALARTPELLPVLREAGVVDAGGQGLCTLLEGMLLSIPGGAGDGARGQGEAALEGGAPAPPEQARRPGAALTLGAGLGPESAPLAAPGSAGAEHYGYCVEFMVADRSCGVEALTGELAALGDSLIVAGLREADGDPVVGNTPVRVHLHTADPDGLIRRAEALGRVVQLQIRDMSRQHAVYLQRRERQGEAAAQVVAVAPGPGLARVALSLGAAVVVVNSRCPSAEELLEAIESAPAESVIVLPNDKNVLPVAEQAARLAAKQVIVVPSASIPQGMAALVAFDDGLEVQRAGRRMHEAMSGVHSLEVARAGRASRLNGVRVRAGQHTAVLDGELVAASVSPLRVIRQALGRLDGAAAQIITLYYGAEVREDQARALADSLRLAFPRAEVETVSGGQPLRTYLVGVEQAR